MENELQMPVVPPRKPLPTNCPNCSAPLRGYKCEYCDTILDYEGWKAQEAEISRLDREIMQLRIQGAILDSQIKMFKSIGGKTNE